MTQKQVSPAPVGAGNGADEHGEGLAHEDSTLVQPSKIAVLLEALLRGERFTRLEAWRLYGDGCANTTVSQAQSRHGVHIARELIEVQGRRRAARVALYWLPRDQRDAARRALAAELSGRRRRGAEGVR